MANTVDFPTPDEIGAWLQKGGDEDKTESEPDAQDLPARIELALMAARKDALNLPPCAAKLLGQMFVEAIKLALEAVAEEIGVDGLILPGFDITAVVFIDKEETK